MKQSEIDKNFIAVTHPVHRAKIMDGLGKAAMYIANGTVDKETILAMLETEIAWFETDEIAFKEESK